eukprot:gene20494-27285_t
MSRFFFLLAMVFALGNACMHVSAEHGNSRMKSGNRRMLEDDAPVEDSSSQDCVQYGCMCIFDFDETLRVVKGVEGRDHQNEDAPADDAVQVIAECKNLGCGIAIASANGNREKLTEVLPKIDAGTFTEDFFNSALFQYGYNDKTNCVAFFDDQEHNRLGLARSDLFNIVSSKAQSFQTIRLQTSQIFSTFSSQDAPLPSLATISISSQYLTPLRGLISVTPVEDGDRRERSTR